MFTLYTINSKSYYLPVKEILTVTDTMCMKKTTSDGRVIHVLHEELPGFLKTVFDELHLYSFDQLKYEIDLHRIHNRLNTFLNLPSDILRKIIDYMCPYEAILANTCQKFRNMVPNPRLTVWAAAATAGDLKLLLALKPKPKQIKMICEFALNGSRDNEEARLNILKYFYNEKKYDLKTLPLEKTASNGDLKILQWATRCMKAQLSRDVVFAALRNGHLPILIWAESEGFKFSKLLFTTGVTSGHLDVIEWGHKKGFIINFPFYASLEGHLHVLEWGYKNGYNQLDSGVLENGASLNRLDIMQWALDHGESLPPHLCSIAASHGHLEALKWAHNNKLTLGETGVIAAAKGHLKILQWVVNQGEKIDEDICHAAAENGKLSVLQWARANGASWDNRRICNAAIESNNTELMAWLKSIDAQWNWDFVIKTAARTGSVKVLQWAKESGAPMDLDAISEAANIIDVISWAIQNGLDPDKGRLALLRIQYF